MELNLSQLESALQAIGDVGKGELTFKYDGHDVTLTVMLPNEEMEAQRFAGTAFDSDDKVSGLSYLDRFKMAILCYAIIRIDTLDFRDVEYVLTGETLQNGQAVKIPRYQAVRQIIAKKFSRTALNHLFKKYYELLTQVEAKAERAIQFEPSDRKTEIERLKKRIAELEEDEKKVADKGTSSFVTDQIKNIVERDNKIDAGEEAEEEATEESPEVPAPVVPARPAVSQPRRPIIPNVVAPTPPPVKQDIVSTEPVGGAIVPPDEDGFENIGSSIANPDDPEEYQKQVDAENARLAKARQMRLEQPRRPPPHVAAKQAAEELEKVQRAEVQAAGSVGGVPAFKIGASQELTEKSESAKKEPPKVNPANTGSGARNPRFRGPLTP